jgi:hypothetical protein
MSVGPGPHVRAYAVIADAGVHNEGQPVNLDDPALDRDVLSPGGDCEPCCVVAACRVAQFTLGAH